MPRTGHNPRFDVSAAQGSPHVRAHVVDRVKFVTGAKDGDRLLIDRHRCGVAILQIVLVPDPVHRCHYPFSLRLRFPSYNNHLILTEEDWNLQMLEIEAKYPVSDLAVLEIRLLASGATLAATREDADYYHNAPDRDFAQTDEAFRLPGSAIRTT